MWASRERDHAEEGKSLHLSHMKHFNQPNRTPTPRTWLRGYPDSWECRLCLHSCWPRFGNILPQGVAPPSKRGGCSSSWWPLAACNHSNRMQCRSCGVTSEDRPRSFCFCHFECCLRKMGKAAGGRRRGIELCCDISVVLLVCYSALAQQGKWPCSKAA